jgi:hypothetical protein
MAAYNLVQASCLAVQRAGGADCPRPCVDWLSELLHLQQDEDDGFDVDPSFADWGGGGCTASQTSSHGDGAAQPDTLPPCPPGTGLSGTLSTPITDAAESASALLLPSADVRCSSICTCTLQAVSQMCQQLPAWRTQRRRRRRSRPAAKPRIQRSRRSWSLTCSSPATGSRRRRPASGSSRPGGRLVHGGRCGTPVLESAC